MHEYIDAVQLFIRVVDSLKKGTTSLNDPLEKLVITTCGPDLAYIDNRRDAREKYGFDFWAGLDKREILKKGISESVLYSESQEFPDFLFRVRKQDDRLIGGSLLELKDSKGGSIASFNSTIPTKYKTLEEIDLINGDNLVSKIAGIIDGNLAEEENYSTFERRCFYLVRTHKEDPKKVKISIVDGSFFETVPKDHLFYQMFLNVLRWHLEKKKIEIPRETLEKVEEVLSYITDQTIIARSQLIEKASVKPRLRIMAEVHPEGNPHDSRYYPEIVEGSFNLILQSSPQVKKVEEVIRARIPEIDVFSIHHKRNGEHIVFQFRQAPSAGKLFLN